MRHNVVTDVAYWLSDSTLCTSNDYVLWRHIEHAQTGKTHDTMRMFR